MKKRLFLKALSLLLCLSSVFSCAAAGVSAFDTSYLTKDGMELGYSIINGYTKLRLRNDPSRTSGRIAVYSGVDVSNVYTIAVGGFYVLTRGVDIDRFITDNDYAVSYLDDFNSYLESKNVENKQSEGFINSVGADNLAFEAAYRTAGLYFFECENDYALSLINENDYVDFVLIDGEVPSNMKDLNFDGITDLSDARLIQRSLAGDYFTADSDEAAYVQFASDYNGDKTIDICDVTDLQRDIS